MEPSSPPAKGQNRVAVPLHDKIRTWTVPWAKQHSEIMDYSTSKERAVVQMTANPSRLWQRPTPCLTALSNTVSDNAAEYTRPLSLFPYLPLANVHSSRNIAL